MNKGGVHWKDENRGAGLSYCANIFPKYSVGNKMHKYYMKMYNGGMNYAEVHNEKAGISGSLSACVWHFCLFCSMTPGDPVEMMLQPEAQAELRLELGLDDPFLVQYGRYIKNIVVHQDLGTSYSTRRPVLDEIMTVFPNTVKLATAAIIIAVILGTFWALSLRSGRTPFWTMPLWCWRSLEHRPPSSGSVSL